MTETGRKERVVVAIPHCTVGGEGRYGSVTQGRDRREELLRQTIAGAIHTFSDWGVVLSHRARETHVIEDALGARLEIVVVVPAGNEAKSRMGAYGDLVTWVDFAGDPRELGFECHRQLLARREEGDWFCYMEDDMLLGDPLSLQKAKWFTRGAGNPLAVLMPVRIEETRDYVGAVLQCDGPIGLRRWLGPVRQDVIDLRFMGQLLRFVRPSNPHAGMFLVSRAQLDALALDAAFGRPSAEFVGLLESAATLAVMRALVPYKPSAPFAKFFSVRHLGARFAGMQAQLRRRVPLT